MTTEEELAYWKKRAKLSETYIRTIKQFLREQGSYTKGMGRTANIEARWVSKLLFELSDCLDTYLELVHGKD